MSKVRQARQIWLVFVAVMASVDLGWDFAHFVLPPIVIPVVLGACIVGFVLQNIGKPNTSERLAKMGTACAVIAAAVFTGLAAGYLIPFPWLLVFVLAFAAMAAALTFWQKMKGAAL